MVEPGGYEMRRLHGVLLAAFIGVGQFVLTANTAWATGFLQTNLVSDIPGLAAITDPNLKNPWGVSSSATSPFWVSDQGASLATLYTVTTGGVSKNALEVTIPMTASGPQGPTGQVNNNTSSFMVNGTPANFIFANLNGTISAWNNSAGTTAQVEATTSGAMYTGLAIGSNASGPLLYAANGAQNRVDVFNGSFAPVNLGPNAFQNPDPRLAGLVPFNVQNIGGNIYVTYALPGRPAQISAPEGAGAVAIFDTNGTLIRTLIADSKLASPWGITLAPVSFGQFGGDLLVGNFSFAVSEVNAFDPVTGAFVGTITDAGGNPIINSGLWALKFGNGGNGGDPNILYFAAGINGEADGLFASLRPVPEPSTFVLLGGGALSVCCVRRRRVKRLGGEAA
jgi:uncharacterized protein (TIGR03118 family)